MDNLIWVRNLIYSGLILMIITAILFGLYESWVFGNPKHNILKYVLGGSFIISLALILVPLLIVGIKYY